MKSSGEMWVEEFICDKLKPLLKELKDDTGVHEAVYRVGPWIIEIDADFTASYYLNNEFYCRVPYLDRVPRFTSFKHIELKQLQYVAARNEFLDALRMESLFDAWDLFDEHEDCIQSYRISCYAFEVRNFQESVVAHLSTDHFRGKVVDAPIWDEEVSCVANISSDFLNMVRRVHSNTDVILQGVLFLSSQGENIYVPPHHENLPSKLLSVYEESKECDPMIAKEVFGYDADERFFVRNKFFRRLDKGLKFSEGWISLLEVEVERPPFEDWVLMPFDAWKDLFLNFEEREMLKYFQSSFEEKN